MNFHMRGFVIIAHIFFFMLFPLFVHAADFGAEIADVDGKVFVTQKATGKKTAAVRGMRVSPGDVIETAAGGEAEILYDDGNVTRLDENTKLEISKLSADPDKTRESVLNLVSGRIKNSVSKLVTKQSKFEVNSKTVTAGVTGTPPWVVSVVGGKSPAEPARTEIDLLKGEKGGVFVRGTDPKGSTIVLAPGTRTVAQMGTPPVNPFPISAARLQELQTRMPITTPPSVRQEKRQQLDAKPVEVSKENKEEKKEEKKEEPKKEEGKQAEEAPKGDATAGAAPSTGNGESESAATAPAAAAGTAEAAATPDAAVSSAAAKPVAPAAPAPAAAVPLAGKAGGAGLVMDYMTHVVSVAPVAVPTATAPSTQDPTGVSTETQITQGSNAIAGASTSAVSGTTRVRVQVGIAYR